MPEIDLTLCRAVCARFGFIAVESEGDSGMDIFVHHEAITNSGLKELIKDTRLVFDVDTTSSNRPVAINLRLHS